MRVRLSLVLVAAMLCASPSAFGQRASLADRVAALEARNAGDQGGTELVNQLQAALYEYYPAALQAFDDWTATPSWSFVQQFPTPELLRQAGRRTVCRRPPPRSRS